MSLKQKRGGIANDVAAPKDKSMLKRKRKKAADPPPPQTTILTLEAAIAATAALPDLAKPLDDLVDLDDHMMAGLGGKTKGKSIAIERSYYSHDDFHVHLISISR